MTEPEIEIRDMLRTRLTDPNPSRTAGTYYVVDGWEFDADVTTNQYPRISIIGQFENDQPWGLNSTNFWSTYRLQIDVWVKGDHSLDIGGTNYEGKEQVRKIMRLAEEALRDYWITDLANTGKFVILRSFNTYSIKYVPEYNLWRRTADVTFITKT